MQNSSFRFSVHGETFDHRTVLLAVMGPAMEFAVDTFLVCISGLYILWPFLSAKDCIGAPRLHGPLPSHYHLTPRGIARTSRGEAAGSGQVNDTQIYGLNSHFHGLANLKLSVIDCR